MDDRENLIGLLRSGYAEHTVYSSNGLPVRKYVSRMVDEDIVGIVADYLIANGVTVQRWIPVTERLPIREYEEWKENNQDADPVFNVMILYEKTPTSLYFDGERWYDQCVNSGKWYYTVTHWMPLPTPPKMVNLEDVVDIEAQTKSNNEAMRKVVNFMVGDMRKEN